MDLVGLLHPSSWPGLSFVWVYLFIIVSTYLLFSKVSRHLHLKATYSSSRVGQMNENHRKTWEKKQKEIDPSVEIDDEVKRPEGKIENNPAKTTEDKRKFKRIFGMESFQGRASCSTGS